MTAQEHDSFVWNRQDYVLAAAGGEGLFDPGKYGLETIATTTANWRGWVARYTIDDQRLMLAELYKVGLALQPDQEPPLIEGHAPVPEGRATFRYPDLDLPMSFTGQLLIARGFIQSLYRHMGFAPAWKFEESWELDLDHGHLVRARETSDEMHLFRKRVEKDPRLDPDHEEKPGWLQRTFSRDLRRSKGG